VGFQARADFRQTPAVPWGTAGVVLLRSARIALGDTGRHEPNLPKHSERVQTKIEVHRSLPKKDSKLKGLNRCNRLGHHGLFVRFFDRVRRNVLCDAPSAPHEGHRLELPEKPVVHEIGNGQDDPGLTSVSVEVENKLLDSAIQETRRQGENERIGCLTRATFPTHAQQTLTRMFFDSQHRLRARRRKCQNRKGSCVAKTVNRLFHN